MQLEGLGCKGGINPWNSVYRNSLSLGALEAIPH
jgi:hypothetical protein